MIGLAVDKGYALSSLVLLLEELAWAEIKKHPDYHELVQGDEIMGVEWMLALPRINKPYYCELLVKIGAANHVQREDIPNDQVRIQEP